MRAFFYLLIILIVTIGAIALPLVSDVQGFLTGPLHLPEGRCYYVVVPRTGLPALAQDLAQLGIIKRPLYLVALGWWRGDWRRFQAGEYLLRPQMTPDELLDMMAAGRVALHSLTLVEGWTFSQAREAVSLHDRLEHHLDRANDREVMTALHASGTAPEGLLFPDTYRFPAGTTDVALLERARRAMQTHLTQEWAQRAPNLPYRNSYEALTLASLVEKETAVPEERPRIAGVFIRRLQRQIPLQTDPTVIYGLGDAYTGRLRRTDLQTDTAYNTYIHHGLPPSPIALPSLASLRAALHPAPGEELYFVSRGDKTHQFSVTLEEHNAAVRHYRSVTAALTGPVR
ncbi:Endolytic murein transglycosylase [Gammaproteobacteria bacterium]